MKKFIITLLTAATLATSLSAHALVYVNGYYRSNGTYVAPHVRTNPDGQCWNNFSGC